MQKFDVSEIQSPFPYMKDTSDDQLLVDTMNMQSMNMKNSWNTDLYFKFIV